MKDNVHTIGFVEDMEDKAARVKMLFYLALMTINYTKN